MRWGFFCASGGVLSANSGRKYPKNASRNPWFLHFLRHLQELLPKICRSRELVCFYSRCRYIGWLKGVVLLPGESILPSGRTTSFFIWAGAAAGLLLSQFPRHLISNETLEGKGNPKTIGFCWRSLVPFCPETDTHHFSRIFLCFFR